MSSKRKLVYVTIYIILYLCIFIPTIKTKSVLLGDLLMTYIILGGLCLRKLIDKR